MIYMGYRTIKTEKKTSQEQEESGHSSVIAGILTTGANPILSPMVGNNRVIPHMERHALRFHGLSSFRRNTLALRSPLEHVRDNNSLQVASLLD
jgi:hypothetical protein